MNVALADPFVAAAIQVLQVEMGTEVAPGERRVEGSDLRCEGVTVLVGVTGEVVGQVFVTMVEETALSIVGLMMGEPVRELDQIGMSAIAELLNMMTGRATIDLERLGYSSNITPPTVVTGSQAEISLQGRHRLVAPLGTSMGPLAVHIALAEAAS